MQSEFRVSPPAIHGRFVLLRSLRGACFPPGFFARRTPDSLAAHVGLGSDFDGAFMPAGMEDASKLPMITESLLRRGYPESDVRKILGENTLRVMSETERIAREMQAGKL